MKLLVFLGFLGNYNSFTVEKDENIFSIYKRIFDLTHKSEESLARAIKFHEKSPASTFNILTGGVWAFVKSQALEKPTLAIIKLVENDLINAYGLHQRKRLINFLKNLVSPEITIEQLLELLEYKTDIIRDVGLDFLAFRSGVFEENNDILWNWIYANSFAKEIIANESNISSSMSSKILFLKFKLLKYLPPKFVTDLINGFVAPLSSVTSPLTAFHVMNNFDGKNFIEFYKSHKELSNSPILQLNITDSIYLNKQKELVRIQEFGFMLPFQLLIESYMPIFKGLIPFISRWNYGIISIFNLFFLKVPKFFFIEAPEKILNMTGIKGALEWTGILKIMRKLEIIGEKQEMDVSDLDALLPNINPKFNSNSFKKVQHLRNIIISNQTQLERLQHNNGFLLGYGTGFFKDKLESMVDNYFNDALNAVFFYLSQKVQTPMKEFVEYILIDDKDNYKLVKAIKLLRKNIKHNRPLPNLLISVKNPDMEMLLRAFIFDNLSDYAISSFKIYNPIALTKFRLNKSDMKNKRPVELKQLATKYYHSNVKKFSKFLQINFTSSESKFMIGNYFSALILQSAKIMNKFYIFMENIYRPFSKIIKCVEVSGFEFLCATRSNITGSSTNSLATSTFLTYVSGTPENNVFLLAFTSNSAKIDTAVISRFSINVQVGVIWDLRSYVILVRRNLLKLMMKFENPILLENLSFEKFVVELAYYFYGEGFTGGDINRFFEHLMVTKILKKYANKVNKDQMIKLIQEVKA